MNAQTVLAIDTSGPRLQLALWANGLTDSLVEEIAKGHAEIIFGRVAALLARHDLAYGDLTRLAVTTGPGSFTGVRIGLSVALGLGLALDIPVIGVSTLRAAALPFLGAGPVAIIADARRGEAYTGLFSGDGGVLAEAAVLPPDEAEAALPAGARIIRSMQPGIVELASFAASADPAGFPPRPAYVRAADAKPQENARIARLQVTAP